MISVIVLTKNRAQLLSRALASIQSQSVKDIEVIVVDDGSTDNTALVLQNTTQPNLRVIIHHSSLGITASRQEALIAAKGEYIAMLDDDDEWIDKDKLQKQAQYLDANPEVILSGGAIAILNEKNRTIKFRPQSDFFIRQTMLLRNNFFTSTVMFRKEEALKAGGFISDGIDLAEDYDLWLRMGKLGQMHNFDYVFTEYTQSSYNKAKFRKFLTKQLSLIEQNKDYYSYSWLAKTILKLRLFLSIF